MADVSLALDLRMEVSEKTSHRVRKYGFGDGYEAMAVDGINSRQTEYAITTEPIKDVTTQATFQDSLDSVAKGNYFVATLAPFSTQQRRYEAVVKDGINTRSTEYSVTTEPIKDATTQTTFLADLDKVATGDYFLATLTPFSTVPRRYRLKDNTYSRQILPSNRAMTFSFTLVEAFSNA